MSPSFARVLATAGLAAAVAVGCAGSAGAPSRAPRAAGARPQFAWVVDNQGIALINTATNKVSATITGKGIGQRDLVASNNGQTIYTADSRSVLLISTATHKIVRRVFIVGLGGQVGQLLAAPGSATIWAQIENPSGTSALVPLSAAGSPGKPVPVPCQEQGPMVITQSASTTYDVWPRDNTVVPVFTRTRTAGKPIKVGFFPQGLAVTPDGKTVYVAASDPKGTLTGELDPITTATNTAGHPIAIEGAPKAVIITPDGKTAFALGGVVTPITTATGLAGHPIRAGGDASAGAITPNGKTLYVTSGETSVTPISVAARTGGKPIPTGLGPSFIAITPDGRTAYVASAIEFRRGVAHKITPIRVATNSAEQRIPLHSYGADFILIAP